MKTCETRNVKKICRQVQNNYQKKPYIFEFISYIKTLFNNTNEIYLLIQDTRVTRNRLYTLWIFIRNNKGIGPKIP